MNLLHFKNRFSKSEPFNALIIPEVTGYMKALQDIQIYLRAKTQLDPAKRMIDAAELSESIGETNDELTEFSSYCSAQFLNRPDEEF